MTSLYDGAQHDCDTMKLGVGEASVLAEGKAPTLAVEANGGAARDRKHGRHASMQHSRFGKKVCRRESMLEA